eukprot:scaffold1044_cov120-Isochrysis_galbana.AAC.17
MRLSAFFRCAPRVGGLGRFAFGSHSRQPHSLGVWKDGMARCLAVPGKTLWHAVSRCVQRRNGRHIGIQGICCLEPTWSIRSSNGNARIWTAYVNIDGALALFVVALPPLVVVVSHCVLRFTRRPGAAYMHDALWY